MFDLNYDQLTSGLTEFMEEVQEIFKGIDPSNLQSLMTDGGDKKQEIMKKLIPLFTKYILPKFFVVQKMFTQLSTELKDKAFDKAQVKQFVRDNCFFCY